MRNALCRAVPKDADGHAIEVDSDRVLAIVGSSDLTFQRIEPCAYLYTH